MRIVALLCNAVLFAFTCLVMATDGAPEQAVYVVFSGLLLLVPLFTVIVLLRSGAGDRAVGAAPAASPAIRRAAAVANLVLLGFALWAYADQYPHPAEEGFLAYVVVVALTPILSAIVLLRPGRAEAAAALR